MKYAKQILSLSLLVVLSFLLSGCFGQNTTNGQTGFDIVDNPTDIVLPGEDDIITARERYENIFSEANIPGQWEGYGVGDPYILRHNGVYYLYVSTKDTQVGVRAWKSLDLINWMQVTGEGLPVGYVSNDPITRAAYAPEVIYWNGTFYMYTSPAGGGHYVLTASSPEGPFVRVTDNLGQSIDGSVFIDDDEQMYFLRSHNLGIRIHSMDNLTTIGTGTTLDNTAMGNWTEGPTLIKRDGIYYLTYTGTHVTSPGYRVGYSVAYENPKGRSSFTLGANNPSLLSTDEDFKGLGHNSIVMGPDMDSYHIVYHNLNSAAGPNRSFNIDRIIFNGARMSVLGPTQEGAQVPQQAAFAYPDTTDTDAFSHENSYTLSKVDSSSNYTAEFNFKGTDDIQFISSYKDQSNYLYVQVSFTSKFVKLIEVKSGTETIVGEGSLVNDFDENKLHTIRIAVRDNKADVYFDNLRKIANAETSISGGKIGYYSTSNDAQFFYTAFSNVAKGMSDQQEAKRVSGVVEANTYLTDGTQFGTGSTLTLLNANPNDVYSKYYAGSYSLTLANKGDYAKYLLDIQEKTFYGFEMYYSKDDAGKKIGIQIDDASVMVVTLPNVETNESFIKALVTEFDLPKGIHSLKLINVGDEFEYVYFSLFESSKQLPSFTHSLENYITTGAKYETIWKLRDGGHYSLAGNKQILYLGDETITDFTLEVKFKFIGETNADTAGILFRSDNLALSSHEGNDSVQGYYIGMNNSKIFLNKYNYNLSEYNLGLSTSSSLSSDVFYTLKIVVRGNQITAYLDNVELFSYTDPYPFSSGRIAFNTEGAAVVYKDLVISE